MCSVSASDFFILSNFNAVSDKSKAAFVLEFLQNKSNHCTELCDLNFCSWEIDIVEQTKLCLLVVSLLRVPGEILSEPWKV